MNFKTKGDRMLFELLTTSIMGAIAVKSYTTKRGVANESGKIQRILSLSGLNVKDGKETHTTQLIRKKKFDWGWEYRYRIPLGRSYDDYVSKLRVLEDGLNNRRKRITLTDLKEIKFDKDILNSLSSLFQYKLTERKEIQLDYDGLLIVRVYDNPLPQDVSFVPGERWRIPVGMTREKNTFKYHDFESIPHLIIGGATRYGKSNFINTLINSLLHSSAEHVHFYLIDLKGGVELCDYEHIKQTESIAYEPEEALSTLQAAYEKMRLIQQQVRACCKKNVQQANIKDRYFIIIDEVGELNPSEAVTREEKLLKQECQTIMSQIARLGAGLGFCQILATQYPVGDVIPRQCKQNSDAKLSFRVQSAVASRVVLDSEGAESLPMIKGRAIYQTADKREIVQTPLITEDVITSTIEPHIVTKGLSDEKTEVNESVRADSITFETI